jgi:hypothetical protein
MKSAFENKDFVNGFLEFCESDQFKKYMVPFVYEEIERLRDKAECCEPMDIEGLQGQIKSYRAILGRAKVERQMISSRHGDAEIKQGEGN